MSDSSQYAQALLRDASQFQWYIVPLLAFVVYIYAVEVERRNWNVLAAGLAFYGAEWFIEIVNALWFHFSDHAPLWGTPGKSSYTILVGLNIEISFMFAIFGIVVAKVLSAVKNRVIVVIVFSVFCVVVETVLNQWGALTWDYWWWGWPHVWSVILFAYGPGTAIAIFAHDFKSNKIRWIIIAGIFVLDAVLLWLGIGVLGWI
ncbi:hypothetical protein [Streptomyces sp. NPDC047108]|uniref:hypothetical protein n=1 Tax=Streptomyces sp. NPDC047108 TaxID=3155025 RepID=UPI0033C4C5C6